MNAVDVLKYGQATFLGELRALPESDWNRAGVCGVWSAKDVVAHLASYELALVDLLTSMLREAPTPVLDRWRDPASGFNDAEVEARRDRTAAEVLGELEAAHARTLELAEQVAPEKFAEAGALPWYGAQYSLDDFIVYTFYGHKREHAAQLAVYRDRLATD